MAELRFRDDEALEQPAVTLDSFLTQSNATAVRLEPDEDARKLIPHLDRLTLVEIAFPKFRAGRGYSSARILREAGYTGELRAVGPMIADQYPMARRVGFDAVEIPDEMAARQPEAQWRARANWQAHDYQARLGHARTRA